MKKKLYKLAFLSRDNIYMSPCTYFLGFIIFLDRVGTARQICMKEIKAKNI